MSRIIYGFSDQGKFSVHNSWDRPTVIHHRELGIKYGNIYPEATWSDVTIKDVPLDITFQWEDEIEEIKSKGVDVNMDNFIISEAANLILPFHREMDEIREDAAGKGKIGTTRRGIGPAYEDKVGRRSIRICDLYNKDSRKIQLSAAITHHNTILKGLNEKPIQTAYINKIINMSEENFKEVNLVDVEE